MPAWTQHLEECLPTLVRLAVSAMLLEGFSAVPPQHWDALRDPGFGLWRLDVDEVPGDGLVACVESGAHAFA
eukprot:3937302-Amphidinium_carterae.1